MTGSLDPIVKRLELGVSASRAFKHFTQDMGQWWPLGSHSLSGEETRTVIFEATNGGRIYEVDRAGREREWGVVLECEENALLVFSWVLERPDLATQVEVRFEPSGDDACIMTLTHRGWDQRPNGEEWRANYNSGWDGVLGCYFESLS